MLLWQRVEPFRNLWAEFYQNLTNGKTQVLTAISRACTMISKQIPPFVFTLFHPKILIVLF